ncbi:MAG: hypothetical protein ISR65_09050 [Bacteriovoracaceae bacterium]|nr:hypothetical protein [Bacteriovoracaceae bacterium]
MFKKFSNGRNIYKYLDIVELSQTLFIVSSHCYAKHLIFSAYKNLVIIFSKESKKVIYKTNKHVFNAIIASSIITLLIVCFSYISYAQENPETMRLLKLHTEHVFHVRYLGATLLELSDQFKDVDAETLDRFLYLHEVSRKNFITGNTPQILSAEKKVLPMMQSLTPVDRSITSTDEFELVKSIFQYFEDSDKEAATDFFRAEGMLDENEQMADNPLVQKYLKIEKIANAVERGRSEVASEEFGRDVLPGHTYLYRVKHDADSARLALALEQAYYSNAQTPQQGRKLIRNYDEYRVHTFTHILRVTQLGKALFKNAPESFNGVDIKILEEFLVLHNQSKLNKSLEFTKRHGLQSTESISSQLYLSFNINFDNTTDDLKKEKQDLSNQLNRIDREVAVDFFRKKGILGPSESIDSNPVVQAYLNIEQIADVVDSSNADSVFTEEYGRPMLPASEFLKKLLPDLDATAHIAYLENNYAQIVRGNTYMDNIPLVRLALKRHRWDQRSQKFLGRGRECMQIVTKFFLGNNFPSLSVK